MADRSDIVQMAKFAEQAERYDDMVAEMKQVAMSAKDTPLSYDERNLLSVAYKNVVGAKRSSWRMLYNHEQNVSDKPLITEYKEQIEKELKEVCDDVVKLLDDHLIPSCESDNESKVFFLKMKGDYYRYLAEVDQSDEVNKENSKDAYNMALDLSKKTMEPANPIRLGLALNFSVFYYEIVRSREEACKLAREAYDDAKAQMNNAENDTKDSYKDSKLIMQLLRDNLTLWVSENTEEGEELEQTTKN
ncbi:14-3-3 protein beta/alpha-B-like [Solea solea]|uniref:14-3-3 protein beta/alpha-B-like n=1 Tax=Solea solea TaxID=90069 RepID=UPI00272C6F3A|nr:14-3-3 protein beta/alpha-B-like [Solea solea]